jgi:cardiolipin synthase
VDVESPCSRDALDRAFSRAAGTPSIGGNTIRLLRNAAENYPAWLEAIESAERTVYFECYIIRDDEAGAVFAEALAAKAREGVRVRLVYDWLGAAGKTPRRFWRGLSQAGVAVRCFNPPRLNDPLGWLHRDHRKVISVDGRVAFVSGLCVAQEWVGDPLRAVDPWRDTGVEVRGPAVAAVEWAFARAWAASGSPIPDGEYGPHGNGGASAGNVALRLVASEPWTARVPRLEQLTAAVARRTLWLTDAYFVGTPAYVQALRAAVRDGVDVRLLVPGGTDIPVLRPLSQAGYRPLLDAGVRVFEWRGSMLHAKTAVADDRWARVGSSNLNLASWIGNWELDVLVEDDAFGGALARTYLDDLENTTEILPGPYPGPPARDATATRPVSSTGGGSAGRIAAGSVRLGNSARAAIVEHGPVGSAEARILIGLGLALLLLAAIGALWPRMITIPLALPAAWIGGALLARAYGGHRSAEGPRAPARTR